MTDAKPYRHRFEVTIIQHAVWLYHRFPLSDRDVQELLHQRGTEVSHETLGEWCINFSPLFAEDLRQQEPRRGSRWYLDGVCTTVDGVRQWLWSAVDEHGRRARFRARYSPSTASRYRSCEDYADQTAG